MQPPSHVELVETSRWGVCIQYSMIEFEGQNAQPSFLITDPNHDHYLSERATRDVTVDDLAGFPVRALRSCYTKHGVDLLIVLTSQPVSPVPACWLQRTSLV